MRDALALLFQPLVVDVGVAANDDHGMLAAPGPDLELVAGVGPARRAEVLAGRRAARRALAALALRLEPAPQWDAADTALARTPSGAPAWPPGVVGSISHSRPRAVAAVADARRAAGLGLDLQRRVPLSEGVARRVRSTAERSAGLDPLVVFSVKEAVYKAVHPLDGLPRSFADATLRLHPGGGAELVEVRPALLGAVHLRWAEVDGFVMAGCWLAPATPQEPAASATDLAQR